MTLDKWLLVLNAVFSIAILVSFVRWRCASSRLMRILETERDTAVAHMLEMRDALTGKQTSGIGLTEAAGEGGGPKST